MDKIDFMSVQLGKIYENVDFARLFIEEMYEEWDEKKKTIRKFLLGGKEKISFEVEHSESREDTSDKLLSTFSKVLNFSNKIKLSYLVVEHMYQFVKDSGINSSVGIFKYIKNNRLEEKKEYRDLKFQKGMKITKVISKIFKTYLNDEVATFFLKEYSMLIQNLQGKETIYISTKLEDIISMSSNTNNWRSCMSTDSEHSYKLGLIEYLNSPSIAVAYTKSSKPYLGAVDNKKWRSLIFVTSTQSFNDNDPVVSVDLKKNYPFENKFFNEKIKEKIQELADGEITTKQTLDNYYFTHAYVDSTVLNVKFRADNEYIAGLRQIEDYSCPSCGSVDLCNCYREGEECAYCGDFHHSENIYATEEGNVCEICFNENFIYCEDCGVTEHVDSAHFTGYDTWVCNRCSREYSCCEECAEFVLSEEMVDNVCEYCVEEKTHKQN